MTTAAARNLFLASAIDRCRWEIGAALVAAADSPCYLDEVYLAELRDLLRTADDALLAGETTIQHHGPYVDLTMAENLCVTRMIRREAASVQDLVGPR